MIVLSKEFMEEGQKADAAYQVILDGLYPAPFMANMGEAAKDEFDRCFDEAMRYLFPMPEDEL
jgi:hypothetical protein